MLVFLRRLHLEDYDQYRITFKKNHIRLLAWGYVRLHLVSFVFNVDYFIWAWEKKRMILAYSFSVMMMEIQKEQWFSLLLMARSLASESEGMTNKGILTLPVCFTNEKWHSFPGVGCFLNVILCFLKAMVSSSNSVFLEVRIIWGNFFNYVYIHMHTYTNSTLTF